jgi:hypothetical protein
MLELTWFSTGFIVASVSFLVWKSIFPHDRSPPFWLVERLNGLDRKLANLLVLARAETERETLQMASLSEIKTAVADNRTVTGSAVTLLTALTAKIQELIDSGGLDQVSLQEILDQINADSTELAAAVAANTPAAPPA